MSGRNPRPGDLYRHFKGKLYQITAVAFDAENGNKKVVYQALYGDYRTYVRDFDAFVGEVDHIKYPEVHAVYRFESVKEENTDTDELYDAVCPSGEERKTTKKQKETSEDTGLESDDVTDDLQNCIRESKIQKASDIQMKEITPLPEVEKPATKPQEEESPVTKLQEEESPATKPQEEDDPATKPQEEDDPATKPQEEEGSATKPQEEYINPDLLAFLEAEENDEKIEVLYRIRKNISENVMSSIEASLDISDSSGSMEDRVLFVRNLLATRAKYEGARLR